MIEHPWPRFTKEGFKKTKVPDDLYLDMAVAYNQARFTDIQQDYYYEEHYGHSVAIVNNRKNEEHFISRLTVIQPVDVCCPT